MSPDDQRTPKTPEEIKAAVEAAAQDIPDPYPPYVLTLKAPGFEKVLTGTHAGTMVSSDPQFNIKFTLSHVKTSKPLPDQVRPNLTIELIKKP